MSFLSVVWLLWEFHCVLDKLEEVLALAHEGRHLWNGVHLESVHCDVLLPQESIYLIVSGVTCHDGVDLADERIAVISSIAMETKSVSRAFASRYLKLTFRGRSCS